MIYIMSGIVADSVCGVLRIGFERRGGIRSRTLCERLEVDDIIRLNSVA